MENLGKKTPHKTLKQKSQASVFLEAGLFQVYPCSRGLALGSPNWKPGSLTTAPPPWWALNAHAFPTPAELLRPCTAHSPPTFWCCCLRCGKCFRSKNSIQCWAYSMSLWLWAPQTLAALSTLNRWSFSISLSPLQPPTSPPPLAPLLPSVWKCRVIECLQRKK